MAGTFRLRLSILFACVLCATNGCVKETLDGDTSVFAFEWWVPWTVLFGGIVGFVAAVLIRNWASRWGWGLMIVAPLIMAFIVPGLFIDHVSVNDQRFTLHTGFWFMPTVHEVPFAELSQIDLTQEERKTRRGTSTSYYLVCHRKSGGIDKVPVGDLMKRGPAEKIISIANAHGIPIVGQW